MLYSYHWQLWSLVAPSCRGRWSAQCDCLQVKLKLRWTCLLSSPCFFLAWYFNVIVPSQIKCSPLLLLLVILFSLVLPVILLVYSEGFAVSCTYLILSGNFLFLGWFLGQLHPCSSLWWSHCLHAYVKSLFIVSDIAITVLQNTCILLIVTLFTSFIFGFKVSKY